MWKIRPPVLVLSSVKVGMLPPVKPMPKVNQSLRAPPSQRENVLPIEAPVSV